MRYRHTYKLLKNYGHSHEKAATIILDAWRGDSFSLRWIKFIFSYRQEIK